ncbi:MAG: hypothetical protein LIP04_11140 [Tannerellaceae bacterium]|nr:hypothetical protein [Tannerellaceae bacterium]
MLEIEEYFSSGISAYVKEVDAINPVYEEIVIRCGVDFLDTPYSRAVLRAAIRKVINRIIAPWQQEGNLPVLGYSFNLQQLHDRISEMKFVKNITHLSVVRLVQENQDNTHRFKEYSELTDTICPSVPYAVLIPVREHLINQQVNKPFGIEDMSIHEHFIIWQDETGKP